MDYRTLHNKYKAITRYDAYSVDLILGIEMEDGGLEGAKRFVDRMVDYRRMHALAERLEELGRDPLDALDALYEAYARGGTVEMEVIAKTMSDG